MKHLRLITTLSLVAMFVSSSMAFGRGKKAEVSDDMLFDMSMTLYDSLTTDSFFKMYKDALRTAKEAGSERYYITTQRMLISRYSVLKDIPAFISESDKVIDECKKSETTIGRNLLYETWNFKADRLDGWGMKSDAINTVQEMTEYAQEHQHMKGLAMAQYAFGTFYLDDHQLNQADSCLTRAWNICRKEGYRDLMERAGFSKINVLINQERYEDALAVADSVRFTISQREADGQRIAPGTRMKLASRLCDIYSRLGEFDEAEAQKDTMMMRYNEDPDRSQQIMVLFTDVVCKYNTGRYLEAIPVLDSIIHIAESHHNWGQIANYTYSLASAQLNAGMKDEAIESFRQYSVAKDSAIVQDSRAQLDELTKKYELAELSLSARKARNRAQTASAVVIILVLIIGFGIMYTKRLLEKNKALYEKVKLCDQQSAEVSKLSVQDKDTPLADIFRSVTELMEDKKLYRDAELNRDALASAVGTNSRYLADAIKEFGGGRTVNDLINWWRLQEASQILKEDAEKPVVVVGEESGFGSSQTFFRLFKEHYGMTPADYRNIALKAMN